MTETNVQYYPMFSVYKLQYRQQKIKIKNDFITYFIFYYILQIIPDSFKIWYNYLYRYVSHIIIQTVQRLSSYIILILQHSGRLLY